MKNMLILSLFISFLSCQKSHELCNSNDLIGTWQLIEVLSDPGDGSGIYQSVESDWIISFSSDGSFYSNQKLCNGNNENTEEEMGSYNTVDQLINNVSCSFDVGYELNGPNLILRYPCREPCGQKFVKVCLNE
jgi:hypothetical protein